MLPTTSTDSLPCLRLPHGQWETEGAFLVCSAWLIESLCHVGRTEEAKELFEDLLARSNDLGLYSEEIDAATDELLGNIPQALTHLGVLGAATALEMTLRG